MLCPEVWSITSKVYTNQLLSLGAVFKLRQVTNSTRFAAKRDGLYKFGSHFTLFAWREVVEKSITYRDVSSQNIVDRTLNVPAENYGAVSTLQIMLSLCVTHRNSLQHSALTLSFLSRSNDIHWGVYVIYKRPLIKSLE